MQHKTVGIIGAGRIGSAYARMMCEGHKCNIIYQDLYQNKFLEEYIADYSKFLESKGEQGVTCTKVETVEELLQTADVGLSACSTPLPHTYHAVTPKRMQKCRHLCMLCAAETDIMSHMHDDFWIQNRKHFSA